jgi:hypothetical protein
MREYEGICIGGGWAGRSMRSQTPHIRYPEPGRLLDEESVNASDAAANVKYNEYRFSPVSTADGEIGFWLPAGATERWAFEQLVAAYVKMQSS